MPFEPSEQGQLTEKDLSFGLWWVNHKVQLRHVLEAALGIIAIPMLVFGAYGFADWYFGTGVQERAQLATQSLQYTDYAALNAARAPKDLQVDAPLVLAAGTGTYDIAARVGNPNRGWWADFDYHFDTGSGAKTYHGFVLPADTSTMTALGVTSDARPAPQSLVIENLHWNRVDLHATRPDYDTWSSARLALTVSEPVFTPPAASDAVQVSRATFTLTNASGFGYVTVPLTVTLLSGSRVVGITRVAISELRAGESRAVDASWFFSLPTVTRVEVKPDLNIFDPHGYIAPGQ
jgi:hypothetical protein